MSHKVCLICLRNADNELDTGQVADKLKILQFLILWERYSSPVSLNLLKSHSSTIKHLFSCSDCSNVISKFCDNFVELEILHLKLSGILTSLVNIMTTAGKVTSRKKELKNILMEDGSNLENVFKEIRACIIRTSKEKLHRDLPRVFIRPISPLDTNITHQHIDLKVEPGLQDHNIQLGLSEHKTNHKVDNDGSDYTNVTTLPTGSEHILPNAGVNLATVKNENLDRMTLHSTNATVESLQETLEPKPKMKLQSRHSTSQEKSRLKKRVKIFTYKFRCRICKLPFVKRWNYRYHVRFSFMHKSKRQILLKRLTASNLAKARLRNSKEQMVCRNSINLPDCKSESEDNNIDDANHAADSYTSDTSSSSDSSLSASSRTPRRRKVRKTSPGRKKRQGQLKCPIEKCDICHLHLPSSSMKYHQKQYHDTKNVDPEKIIQCPVKNCSAYFLTRRQSNRHQRIVHNMKQIKCSYSGCKFIVYDPERLKHHESGHTTVRIHCKEKGCSSTFMNETKFRIHQRRHGNFKCKFCEMEKNYAPDLAMHEQQHATDRKEGLKFQCTRCKFATNNKIRFIHGHFVPTHLTKLYQSTVCSKNFVYSKSLKKHMASNHVADNNNSESLAAECNLCTAHFRKSGQLINHKIKSHWNQKCPKCNYVQKGKNSFSNLKRHIQMEHKELFPELPFSCIVCKLLFETQEKLSNHSRAHEESYQCSKCEASYKSKESLYLHEKSTHEESRFVCAQCGKKFGQKAQLTAHMEYHKNPQEWQFGCETCGKKFTTKEKLEVHQRTHTQEKPYVCEFCGQKYAHRHNWRNHMKTKHDAEPPKLIFTRTEDTTNRLSRKGTKVGDCILSGARKNSP